MKKILVGGPLLIAFVLLQSAGEETPLEFDGFTEAYRLVYLSSSVDGVIASVTVDRGAAVRVGDVLAVLEATVEKATLKLTEARTKLKGELKGQRARLGFATNKLRHDEQLHTQGVLSAEELEESSTEKQLAEAAVLKAEESLRLAALENERAQAAVDLRTIRSPVDGVVIDRFVSPGELVTRVNHSRIIAVAQIDPLRVEVLVPGAHFGIVEVGQKAVVTPEVFPDRSFEAEVKTVDPLVDAASGMFRVRLELVNADHDLAAGLKCLVRFQR